MAQHRRMRALSMRALGRAADTSATYIMRLERGDFAEPSPLTLRRIAGALHMPAERLLKAAGYI